MNETRVLLVEDEPGYARYLREILYEVFKSSHRITWVETLTDAVARLGNGNDFDIVLLDLGLPDADGTEALMRVSASSPATPIVVLSALSDVDVALGSMRLGALEYLVKGQSEHVLLPRAIRYAIERKRLQDVAASARAEAERANAVKDEFLAMLSHELRNPLAPIVTALELMRQHGYAPLEHEITVVQRQVDHLVRLVDDLLDVARIVRGKLELHEEDVDVADIVASGVEIAKPLVEQRNHALSMDAPHGSLFVRGDRVRLTQVVANLLTNAAKYTDVGGIITVSACRNNDSAEIRVRDNGMGMTPELLARVFELFEQGARTIDRTAGGLGLGLAIVRNIVTLHGGSVDAASEGLGNGSEFVVRLPLRAPVSKPEAASPEPPSQLAAASRRVLIVDDNEDGAELLAAGLAKLGYTTRAYRDGPSALEAAKEFRPDIALLDIGLPIMDGYEVARRLRALLGELSPVLVALTGYGQLSDQARSRDAGFDYHLVKPIGLAALRHFMASVPYT